MKVLTIEQANQYLKQVGMQLDNADRIADIADRQLEGFTRDYRAPTRDAYGLLNFCYHVAGWLPRGDWKIFQIHQTGGPIWPREHSLVSGLLFGADYTVDFTRRGSPRTFLFEFDKSRWADQNSEMLIANLIYVFLLFNLYGDLVSSHSMDGETLTVADGYVYFSSRVAKYGGAEELLRNYEANPDDSPQWLIDIAIERQEESMAGGENT